MDEMKMASGEDSLISRYFKPLATDPGAFNLGDDAAILNNPFTRGLARLIGIEMSAKGGLDVLTGKR